MSLILNIDTATEHASICLTDKDRVLLLMENERMAARLCARPACHVPGVGFCARGSVAREGRRDSGSSLRNCFLKR